MGGWVNGCMGGWGWVDEKIGVEWMRKLKLDG